MTEMRMNLMKGLLLLAVCLSACTEKVLKESHDKQNDFPVLSASEILNNLGNSFKDIPEDSAGMQMRSANAGVDLVYPDYYGGGYLDADGDVIVLVKGEPEGFAEEFRKRTRSCNVIVRSCEYSYNELVTLVDSLNAVFLDDALCNELGWTGIGIDTEKNRVMIDLLPLTEEAKRRFKNQVCRSSAIEFKKGGVSVLDATTNMGGRISYLKYGASIGYRAKNSKGASGFVTAGHLVPKVGGAILINGQYGADCKNTQCSGNIDAAFCQLQKGYSISNRTEYGNVTIKAVLFPIANLKNARIAMEGHSTAGVSKGTISNTNVTRKFKNKFMPGVGYVTCTISNMILSTYPSKHGDSGGIVYDEVSKRVVGVHTGRHVENNQFRGSYTSYAGYINKAFNLVLE